MNGKELDQAQRKLDLMRKEHDDNGRKIEQYQRAIDQERAKLNDTKPFEQKAVK